jgi:hypothetical protein
VETMGLRYKSIDYVGELEGDACAGWKSLGGRKSIGAEVVCQVKVVCSDCISFPRSNCGWMNFEYLSRGS